MKKPKTYDKITGEWVKEQRIRAGLSQKELAENAGLCDFSHVSKIERTGVMSDRTKYLLFDFFCVAK